MCHWVFLFFKATHPVCDNIPSLTGLLEACWCQERCPPSALEGPEKWGLWQCRAHLPKPTTLSEPYTARGNGGHYWVLQDLLRRVSRRVSAAAYSSSLVLNFSHATLHTRKVLLAIQLNLDETNVNTIKSSIQQTFPIPLHGDHRYPCIQYLDIMKNYFLAATSK